ncbi:glycosyltransferase family 4 protein [Bifidobacterium apri]|uniref:glycosyltransferase family 4 protein n=1 Tax=Bifidobacterium apri TaxID=1769423 RepID=UPI003994920D
MVANPSDAKYLKFATPTGKDGVVLLIHESNRLGASLLLLHTAEEMVKQGINVYIISRQFGELNDEYAAVAPTQIILAETAFKMTLKRLKDEFGYHRILMVTASVGDWTKAAHDLGYNIVSEIHELAYVVQFLGLEKATREMLNYSDKIVFSTTIARSEVLNLVNAQDDVKIIIRPQGVYFKKADPETIRKNIETIYTEHPDIKDKKIVVGIGNTSGRKGFDLFIKTAKLVPNDMFLWAGKRELFFNKAVKSLGSPLPNNFLYLGQMNSEQLSALYSIASILLLSSRKDTLPSVIFEALIFDVPIIAARDSGGAVDLVNDENGVLTDTADALEFAKAIQELLNPDKLAQIKKHITNQDREKYSFSEYIRYIVGLF